VRPAPGVYLDRPRFEEAVTVTAIEATTQEQIRQLLDTQHSALRAKDPDQLLGTYTDDLVSFSLAPPLQLSGAAALDREGLLGWFGTWDGPIIETIAELTSVVAESEGIAYCHGLVNLQGTKRAGGGYEGGPVDLWFRSTWGLRRSDGEWKVAHEHNSTPFYMDGSDRAANDLKPEAGA
jgi:ketosteroid isomerase-like protein